MNKENFIKLSVFLNLNDEYTSKDAEYLLFAYANNNRMHQLSEHTLKSRFQTFIDYAFDAPTIEHHRKIYDMCFLDKELDGDNEPCIFKHIEK